MEMLAVAEVTKPSRSNTCFDRAPIDDINIRILQNMISGIPLILGQNVGSLCLCGLLGPYPCLWFEVCGFVCEGLSRFLGLRAQKNVGCRRDLGFSTVSTVGEINPASPNMFSTLPFFLVLWYIRSCRIVAIRSGSSAWTGVFGGCGRVARVSGAAAWYLLDLVWDRVLFLLVPIQDFSQTRLRRPDSGTARSIWDPEASQHQTPYPSPVQNVPHF